jgi:hypothetical protein
MKLSSLKSALVALAALATGITCTGTTTTTYYDPYLYTYYYPADVAYSTYYWTDAWVYSDVYYSQTEQQQTPIPTRWTVGNAIRALARGDNTVCPGHVTVTPKMSPSACNAGQMVRSGVTIVFNACTLSGGGTVDGTIDVSAMQNASDPACAQGSTITVTHTTTITNLAYKGSGGLRLVIPSQTDTGTNTFNVGETPAMVSINSTGRFQYFDTSNKLVQDQNFNGTRTFKFAGSTMAYSVDGLINLKDNTSTMTSTITASGLTRTNDCCYPTGGNLHIARMTGSTTDQHSYTFGPTCGAATQDSNTTTLATCQ